MKRTEWSFGQCPYLSKGRDAGSNPRQARLPMAEAAQVGKDNLFRGFEFVLGVVVPAALMSSACNSMGQVVQNEQHLGGLHEDQS